MSHPHTRLAHAGCEPDPSTGAVVAPIHLSSTFERAADGSYPHGYIYGRLGNPTRKDFEEAVAGLEGGTRGFAFASGMAASMSVLQALEPGDHLILPEDLYYGVRNLVETTFARWGLRYTAVDQTDLGALEAALTPETRLVWAETPSNPQLKVVDLATIAEHVKAAGAMLLVDGTWTTPLLQRPLELGADLVLHSATKFLGGHSDLVGGVVVAKEENAFTERIAHLQQIGGAVMDPFSAWLALRGMRSLGARLRLQCENASTLAAYLEEHPRVRRTYYPGLPSHQGHATAARQMDDFGAMLSFEFDGSGEEALAAVARARVFRRATSLGGTESLIEHRASIEPEDSPTPPSLIRCSTGLEHADDLLEDLARVLGD